MFSNDLTLGSLWDSFRGLERTLEDAQRTFADNWRGLTSRQPAMNVWANDDSVMVALAAPGLDPASIDIGVTDDTVSIIGKRPVAKEEDGASYYRRERADGDFSRSLQLPFRVAADQAEARYSKGVLYLALRRPEEEKPKKITVKAA
jgi:HSP20 family protein